MSKRDITSVPGSGDRDEGGEVSVHADTGGVGPAYGLPEAVADLADAAAEMEVMPFARPTDGCTPGRPGPTEQALADAGPPLRPPPRRSPRTDVHRDEAGTERPSVGGSLAIEPEIEPDPDSYVPDYPWQGRFLRALASSGIVRAACLFAGVSRATAYRHYNADVGFAAAWDDAADEAADVLEAEAWRRARVGTEKPVFYKGRQCGKIREYSDTLLIFLLKGLRPEKYRDNYDVQRIIESLAQPGASTQTPDRQ